MSNKTSCTCGHSGKDHYLIPETIDIENGQEPSYEWCSVVDCLCNDDL